MSSPASKSAAYRRSPTTTNPCLHSGCSNSGSATRVAPNATVLVLPLPSYLGHTTFSYCHEEAVGTPRIVLRASDLAIIEHLVIQEKERE